MNNSYFLLLKHQEMPYLKLIKSSEIIVPLIPRSLWMQDCRKQELYCRRHLGLNLILTIYCMRFSFCGGQIYPTGYYYLVHRGSEISTVLMSLYEKTRWKYCCLHNYFKDLEYGGPLRFEPLGNLKIVFAPTWKDGTTKPEIELFRIIRF